MNDKEAQPVGEVQYASLKSHSAVISYQDDISYVNVGSLDCYLKNENLWMYAFLHIQGIKNRFKRS